MKVILRKSVPKLGKKDDVCEVPEGYARNALFIRGLAIPATEEALRARAVKEENARTTEALEKNLLERNYQEIQGQTLVLPVPHTKEGVLFKKVHEKDVLALLASTKKLSFDEVDLSVEGIPIKKKGEYMVRSRRWPQYFFILSIQ